MVTSGSGIYSNEWIREVINDSYARMRDKTALPLIMKSRQVGMTSIVDMLREKQSEADLAARQQGDWKWPEYKNGVYVDIDPAKPGSDVTVIRRVANRDLQLGEWAFVDIGSPGPPPVSLAETMRDILSPKALKDDLANPERRGHVPSIEKALPAAPSFDVDHAWDMLLLAARTSRYGE